MVLDHDVEVELYVEVEFEVVMELSPEVELLEDEVELEELVLFDASKHFCSSQQ